jgi:hypothetical protein
VGAPYDREARVQGWIRNARSETFNPRRERHFSNHTLAYLGPFLVSNIFAGAGDRDIDPAAIPVEAAIGAALRDLKAVRVFQGGRFLQHSAGQLST